MPGKRRSSEEWQQLIAEFESGTENTTAFCSSRGISTSNFYKRRTARAGMLRSTFVVARRAAPPAAPVSVQFNDVTIRCDVQTPVAWVCDLVATLRG